MKNQRNLVFVASILLVGLVDAKNFFTPLNKGYEFACVAENLKESSTYYCDSYGKVRCLPGWSDPYGLCQTPVCEVNGQTCVNGNCSKPFTCDCEVGWWGQFCEKCVPLPGCANGYCNRSLECICKYGWEGMTCDKPSCPDCVHGECVMPGMCACHPGWSGPNCTICEPRLDCKFGRCVDEPFECRCFSKYEGVSCDKPMCKEGCHPENGFCEIPETCFCKPGWTGENCTECVPYWNCHNGRCIDDPWECVCDDGFTGIDCRSEGNVDGHWGKWSQWSQCSVSCGTGTQTRTRKCDYPPPAGNGTYCSQDGSSCDDLRDCKEDPCPGYATVTTPQPHKPPHKPKTTRSTEANTDSGFWGDWSEWSECSATCGGGVQDRFRDCIADDMTLCQGESEDVQDCNTERCPSYF